MVIVRIYEGLGNQLFQYAYARALDLSTKQKVFLDFRETGSREDEKKLTPRSCGLKNFRIALPVCTNVEHFYPYINNYKVIEKIKTWPVQKYIPYKYFSQSIPLYEEHLMDLKGNWYLQGWFQDSRYFQSYADIIKREIMPKKQIKISSELKMIFHLKNTVSIHFRRSDFKKNRNTLPTTYYYNAMRYMQNVTENPFWIIFSDDIDWVKKNIDFGQDCYFLSEKENLKDYEELMVMSCCKNHIIANSTYSWWGAWLGRNENKIVIGPNKWFLRKVYDTAIMPEDWIQMPVK